tara:strand:+ start:272 stop:517 length:246 start_codon:yes stop_codon:yes gene_type:complete
MFGKPKEAHKKDGRDLWLDENVVSASTFLAAIHMKERKRELNEREQDMKSLALAYLFLYNVVEEQNLLQDVESFFTKETIH